MADEATAAMAGTLANTNPNDAILRGVANILQDASQALARLGSLQAPVEVGQELPLQPGEDSGASLGVAAVALAQVAAQFGGLGAAFQQPMDGQQEVMAALTAGAFCNGSGQELQEPQEPGAEDLVKVIDSWEQQAQEAQLLGGLGVEDRTRRSRWEETPGLGLDPEAMHSAAATFAVETLMSTTEFVTTHGLDAWLGDALELLTPEQRYAVMEPPLNKNHARNLNGIVVSRIKQAVPLDQRLGIFVEINGLSEGVVDRISTLTPEQAEAVMESGIKIQKASNPSGVAMRRISDVLRCGSVYGSSLPSGEGSGSRDRSRTPGPLGVRDQMTIPGTGNSDIPEDVQQLMNSLGLEWWCGEVLKRLSLWQRQQVMRDVPNMQNARNPSGIVMSRVRQFVDVSELMTIFIDINQFDGAVQAELWALSPEQQQAVINPGIYLQNVRNPSTAVRSRIKNVLSGNDAFGKPQPVLPS